MKTFVIADISPLEVVTLCIVAALLILALLIQLARRRRAEQRLHPAQEAGRVSAEEGHHLLAAMVESANDAIIGFTPDRMIFSWNPSAEKLFGYSAEEAVGQDVSIILPPDRSQEMERLFSIAHAGRTVDQFETVRRRKDGNLVDVSISVSPIRDERGKIIGAAGIIRDISQRKLTEERLSLLQTITIEVAAARDMSSALEVVLRRVCEKTGWALGQAWVPRQDGMVLDCSQAWFSGVDGLEKFRATSEGVSFPPGVGLPGRVWASKQASWIFDVTQDANFPRADMAEEVGLKAALAIPILSGDEVLAVIEFFLRQPRGRDEQLVQVIATIAAELGLVMERKQAEESLMWEKSFCDTTIDSLPGVFYHYNDEGRFLRWNKNFERVTGYSHEEIAGMHPLDFFSGDDKQLIATRIGEVFTTGEGSAEAGLVCKDGRAIQYFFTGRRVLFEGKAYLIGMGIDITERMRAEEELRRTQAELAHVSRVTTMGELAASIAHEVNQPLGTIVGNADICLHWLADDHPDLGQVREALADIASEGHRASEVIARIRALIKQSAPQKTLLDFNEVVHEVLGLIGHEVQWKQVTLRAELDGGLPLVHGDRVQLQQVLLNLMMNGIEAMSGIEGRARELRVMTSSGEDNEVVTAVCDTGVGLKPQEAERVFKAFHTTKPGGMGMGLAISRSIIDGHGGRLWATANDGPGATFQFTLPAGNEGG